MNKKFYLEALLKYKNIYFRQAQWEIASYLRGLEHTWFIENKEWDESSFLIELKDIFTKYNASTIDWWDIEEELKIDLRDYKLKSIIR